MIYRARHVTTYAYAEPVALSHHLAHLTPRERPSQSVLAADISVTPTPATWNIRTDHFGNTVVQFAVQHFHSKLVVDATCEVSLTAAKPPDPDCGPAWEAVRDRAASETGEVLEVAEFLADSGPVQRDPGIAAYASPSFEPGVPIVRCLLALQARINRDFVFDTRATTVATPLREVLEQRRGVCQDFAHLMIAALRSLGVPARYVSGYLRTKPPPGRPRLVGADASHAWVSAWTGAAWLDLDPTNNCIPSLDHITLAWGRDYDDVAPLKGVALGGGAHTLKVGVDVLPADEEAMALAQASATAPAAAAQAPSSSSLR